MKAGRMQIPAISASLLLNNYPLAQFTEPTLTSIDIDTYLLGEQAASALFQAIENNANSQQILVSTRLFERESTNREH